MWQALRGVRLDCDSDALCFSVKQHGEPPAFCHKTSTSCWGDGGVSGLSALEATLRQIATDSSKAILVQKVAELTGYLGQIKAAVCKESPPFMPGPQYGIKF